MSEKFEALRAASQTNEALRADLAQCKTEQEWADVAARYGYELDPQELGTASRELSDAELEGASGGYTFPRTDWIYCDNPWTNYWCTLRC